MPGKNTILKAIHNLILFFILFFAVWMLGKNTILKAIHNSFAGMPVFSLGVNAG